MGKVYDLSFENRVEQAIKNPPRPGEPMKEVSDDEISDGEKTGLKLRVRHSGQAAWYVYMYDKLVKKHRYEKIANFSTLTIDQARDKAKDRRTSVRQIRRNPRSLLLSPLFSFDG